MALDPEVKKYVDDSINQVESFSNRKLGDTPTDAQQLTPKGYVDTQVASIYSSVTSALGFDYQAFTASGTWNKPTHANLNSVVKVYMWGAGGGGGGIKGNVATTTRGGAGGGGGAFVYFSIAASMLGATEAVNIGAGGTGGSSAGGNGTAGGYLSERSNR